MGTDRPEKCIDQPPYLHCMVSWQSLVSDPSGRSFARRPLGKALVVCVRHGTTPSALIGENGGFVCDGVPGHTTEDVLNLGYGRAASVGAPRTAAPMALT